MRTKRDKQRTFIRMGLVNAVIVFGLLACTTEDKQDVKIFYGGTILTVDNDFSEVEAIVVQGNNILATGDLLS